MLDPKFVMFPPQIRDSSPQICDNFRFKLLIVSDLGRPKRLNLILKNEKTTTSAADVVVFFLKKENSKSETIDVFLQNGQHELSHTLLGTKNRL